MFNCKKIARTLVAPAVLGLVVAMPAQATTISDGYIGSNSHGYGDVIGDASVFDIQSMNVTVSGTTLNVSINTNFAGNAGVDSNLVTNGIGYGDLFLSSSWNPYGSAPYTGDNASNGTVWNYGISLDNRWSNTGGSATLYSLNAGNNSDLLLSNDFINCGSGCIYRDGQAVAVNSQSDVSAINAGIWSVDASGKTVNFSMNLAGTGLLGSDIGVRWEMTCANDAIEGSVSTVPLPAAFWLFASGMLGLVGVARRKNS